MAMTSLQRLFKFSLVVGVVSVSIAMSGCASIKGAAVGQTPTKVVFNEVWGYLIRGHEDQLTGAEPFTDICYFSAELTDEGRIPEAIARPSLALGVGVQPRIYLVVTELSNSSLMHFSLNPTYGVRPLLVGDICRVSQDFDGVQIDFEAVPREEAQNFWDFLQQLRNALPSTKTLSVALPARTGAKADAYQYSKIAPIVDRVIIMAYDEHWSTSSPGPVASLPWCSNVLAYAQTVIDNGKIVMGLPLYGRAWQDKKLARALGFQSVQDLITGKNARTGYQSEIGPYFEYSENVQVKVFYDDVRSLREKLELYKSKAVRSIAFWRIGLNPVELWSNVGSPFSDQGQESPPSWQ
jgi:spore germination protein